MVFLFMLFGAIGAGSVALDSANDQNVPLDGFRHLYGVDCRAGRGLFQGPSR